MPKIIEPVLTPQDAEWGRQVNARQRDSEAFQDRFGKEQAANNKATAAALASLTQQLQQISAVQKATPIPAATGSTVTPISATSTSFTTVASAILSVPADRTTANFMLVGSVALLDTVTGGIAAPPSARFLIGSNAYPRSSGVPATKDSGASMVNNVSTVGAGGTLDVTGLESITIQLQVAVFHGTAYATASASNFATFGAQISFS